MQFPIYRKYSNGKNLFRINSFEHFIELKIMGNRYSITEHPAKILPDRVLIEDMINRLNNHWVDSNEEEFEKTISYCKSNLTLFEH